jgi:rhodanese-related sulfurtransferase
MRLFVAAALGLLFALASSADETRLIDQEALLARMAQHQQDLVILDVRTPEEFAAGHVPGAVNIPHDQLAARLGELETAKSKDIVVYCRTGRRSSLALEILQANGFKQLSHLEGDMVAWQAQNRPVETSAAEAKPATPGPGPR